MKKLLILALLTAIPAWAIPLVSVQNQIDAALDPGGILETSWLPSQEAFFDANGDYGQCLESSNFPAHIHPGAANSVLGDRINVAPSNGTGGQTCADILGPSVNAPKVYNMRWFVSQGDLGEEWQACLSFTHSDTGADIHERCEAGVRAGTGPGGIFQDIPWRVRPTP